jgi:hypothetical protein
MRHFIFHIPMGNRDGVISKPVVISHLFELDDTILEIEIEV